LIDALTQIQRMASPMWEEAQERPPNRPYPPSVVQGLFTAIDVIAHAALWGSR
jgi:hypothetical protein